MTDTRDAARQLNVSAICLSCGLCCNGGLNFAGDLQPDEVPAARRCGLDVCDTISVPAFRLPCPQYRNRRCAVYNDPGRPETCRKYSCWVIERYLSGQITARSAQRLVASAIALHNVVAARIGSTEATAIIRVAKAVVKLKNGHVDDESGDEGRRFERHLSVVQGARDESGHVSAELMRNVLRAGGFLRRHFVWPESARRMKAP